VSTLSPEARAGHAPLVELEHLTKHFPVKQGVFSRARGVVHASASSASLVAASRRRRG